MSRYIDADALTWLVEEYKLAISPITEEQERDNRLPLQMLTEFENMISEQPTVDAVPVVHGEWTIDGMNEYELSYGCIGYEPRYRCSRCGITTESYLRTEKPIMPEDADFPNYCPNCGAKMDAESEADADYQASVLMQEYFERYEPTYNSEDGSM